LKIGDKVRVTAKRLGRASIEDAVRYQNAVGIVIRTSPDNSGGEYDGVWVDWPSKGPSPSVESFWFFTSLELVYGVCDSDIKADDTVTFYKSCHFQYPNGKTGKVINLYPGIGGLKASVLDGDGYYTCFVKDLTKVEKPAVATLNLEVVLDGKLIAEAFADYKELECQKTDEKHNIKIQSLEADLQKAKDSAERWKKHFFDERHDAAMKLRVWHKLIPDSIRALAIHTVNMRKQGFSMKTVLNLVSKYNNAPQEEVDRVVSIVYSTGL